MLRPVQFGLNLKYLSHTAGTNPSVVVEVESLSEKDRPETCLPVGTRLTLEGDDLFINHRPARYNDAAEMSYVAGTLLATENFMDLPEPVQNQLRNSLGDALGVALDPDA